jgi:uncharacterized cupin superfamily protein
MNKSTAPALDPADVPEETATNYPQPFAQRVAGRHRRRLGNAFGLNNFGVNLVTLAPGGQSALRHWHTKQDEFVFVLEGELVLVTDAGRQLLGPGMCAGYPAGKDDGHHLINESGKPARYLEVGDRTPGDAGAYPDDDLAAQMKDGKWMFTHKDGKPY